MSFPLMCLCRAVNRCTNGVAVGFQLRSERNLGRGDDTAANDFQVICSNEVIVTGDGMDWGVWTGWRTCSPGRALCGIQSQFEASCGDECMYVNLFIIQTFYYDQNNFLSQYCCLPVVFLEYLGLIMAGKCYYV